MRSVQGERPILFCEPVWDYEIMRLQADRCLFITGEGQITDLQDYEFTEATDLGASLRLRNYEITSWQIPFYFWGKSNYEITRLRVYRDHWFGSQLNITKLRDYELTDAFLYIFIAKCDMKKKNMDLISFPDGWKTETAKLTIHKVLKEQQVVVTHILTKTAC